MNNDDVWIVGRKEIMKQLQRDTWRTVVRWKKRYGLKFVQWPNGQPAITVGELKKFLTEFSMTLK